MVDGAEGEDTPGGITVDVSQARLDIVAFSKLASINHQRIRRVAASSWTFRATDFANRIVSDNWKLHFSILTHKGANILGQANECRRRQPIWVFDWWN